MIKFKAWHRDLKEMFTLHNANCLAWPDKTYFELLNDNHRDYIYGSASNVELLEWTGCKDNSGLGLYEKDIIFIRFGDRRLKGIVHWDDDHLTWWVEFLDNSGNGELLAEIHDFDIMGNGYTHPHLLVDE